jgi:two-component system, sensor histidine kinase YesM
MYSGDLQIVWNVPPELLGTQIPKNMIQPLVENALFHGMINQETGELNGEIRISLEKVPEGLLLTVRDNGVGMERAQLEKLLGEKKLPEDRGRKIGLSNINSRLHYLYGTTDCLKIESAPYQGTTVTILFRQG